jgi:hypothetical protein
LGVAEARVYIYRSYAESNKETVKRRVTLTATKSEEDSMKTTKKAKPEVKKTATRSLSRKAVRDLELLDPAARKLKGGGIRKPGTYRP